MKIKYSSTSCFIGSLMKFRYMTKRQDHTTTVKCGVCQIIYADHANPVQSVCSESALFAINDNTLLSLVLDVIHLFIYFSQRHIRLTLALYILLFYGSVSGCGDFQSIPHRENLDSLCTHSDWSASPICDL